MLGATERFTRTVMFCDVGFNTVLPCGRVSTGVGVGVAAGRLASLTGSVVPTAAQRAGSSCPS
jgi:hypothetical protein